MSDPNGDAYVSGLDDVVRAIRERPTLFAVALLAAFVVYGAGQYGLRYVAPDPETAFSLGWALGVVFGAGLVLLAVRREVPLRALAEAESGERGEGK